MIDRKEAIRKYKERKPSRGIFTLRSPSKCWVDSALELGSIRNRIWSELKHNAHRNPELQAEWNLHGEAAFEMEVVETLAEDVLEMAVRDELKRKRKEWAAKLGAPAITP